MTKHHLSPHPPKHTPTKQNQNKLCYFFASSAPLSNPPPLVFLTFFPSLIISLAIYTTRVSTSNQTDGIRLAFLSTLFLPPLSLRRPFTHTSQFLLPPLPPNSLCPTSRPSTLLRIKALNIFNFKTPVPPHDPFFFPRRSLPLPTPTMYSLGAASMVTSCHHFVLCPNSDPQLLPVARALVSGAFFIYPLWFSPHLLCLVYPNAFPPSFSGFVSSN